MKRLDAKIDATLALLCERFPRCFFHYERRRRPLKIGIYHDLIAALDGAVDAKLLSKMLWVYTFNVYYRQAQTAGAARIDLDGNAAGEVTPAEAANAAKTLAGMLKAQRRKCLKKQNALTRQKQSAAPLADSPVPQQPTPATPRRDGLAALKAAALQRKRQSLAASSATSS
jgi:ProP effector